MAEEFVIVQVGMIEDGRTPAYQIFQRTGDWTVEYYVPLPVFRNDPVVLGEARARLDRVKRTYGVEGE